MKIIQNEDGSGVITFDESEKKIIVEKGELTLTPEFLRDFSNVLMKLAVDVNEKLPDGVKNKESRSDENIEIIK